MGDHKYGKVRCKIIILSQQKKVKAQQDLPELRDLGLSVKGQEVVLVHFLLR